jgi:cytochrome c biogenesis protein CcdA
MSSVAQLGLAVVAGSLTTLSPCVFPILPLVLGGALQANRLAPLAMGVGMASSFALLGLAVGALGPLLDIDGDAPRSFAALLLVVFGLAMLLPGLGERFARGMQPLASSANAASARLDTSSLGGALLLGGLLGLVWSPCSGPLLASALSLVATSGGAAQGALILGLFGSGAALPLVAVAYASRRGFTRAKGWVLANSRRISRLFGGVLVLSGVMILSGADRWLEARLVAQLPDAWVRLTTAF